MCNGKGVSCNLMIVILTSYFVIIKLLLCCFSNLCDVSFDASACLLGTTNFSTINESGKGRKKEEGKKKKGKKKEGGEGNRVTVRGAFFFLMFQYK